MEQKQLQEAYASIMDKPNRKDLLAQLLVEWIQPNHIAMELISRVMPSRSMTIGDALVKKVRRGITVHTLVPGAVHLASQITVSERTNYILDGADVKVTYNEWELETGEIGTVAEIRNEMLAKLRDYYLARVFTALTTVWTAVNTPNNFINLGTAVTATALENAIDYINQTTGGVKVVMGVRSAMTPISKFGAFWDNGAQPIWTQTGSQEKINQVLNTGALGVYYGAPLLSLDQVYNNPVDYQQLLNPHYIVVVGENVGEFITYGTEKWKQWSDMNPTPPQWMLEVYQQFGLIVDNAQGIYVIQVA
jgi:hypothetical protein